MHLERGGVDQKARTDELVVLAVIAEDMADILAKETLDAFPEFLDAIDVFLLHSPGAIRRVGRTRLEGLDLFLYSKIPGHVRDQVLRDRERFDRLDRDRLVERQVVEPRH